MTKKLTRPGIRHSVSTKALMLRTCAADMSAYGGFIWPESGPVECPDWNPESVCGNGLHGALWGEGDGSLFSWADNAKWLVVEVNTDDVVDLGGKIKVPRGVVVHCGDRESATSYIADHGVGGRAIIGGTATAGDGGTATAGYGGTATAGDGGTATAGYGGTATAGNRGTAIAGDGGTATAGNRGTATAGYGGTATAGDGGTIMIRWWDEKSNRYRMSTGYVGEDGIEADRAYRIVHGVLVPEEQSR